MKCRAYGRIWEDMGGYGFVMFSVMSRDVAGGAVLLNLGPLLTPILSLSLSLHYQVSNSTASY